jgi:uncharacterized protein (TIGR03067 family)
MPLVVTLFLGAQAAQKDEEKMQGTWTVVSAEKDGARAPEEAIQGMKVVIQGKELTIQHKGRNEKLTFKLDASKKPKVIDMTHPRDKGENVPGIYELDGNNLKMCWRKGGGERPTKFAAEAKSGLMMMVLKREKKE